MKTRLYSLFIGLLKNLTLPFRSSPARLPRQMGRSTALLLAAAAIVYGTDQTFITAWAQGLLTEGNSLSGRTYNSDETPTNTQFVVDFPITSPGSLQNILTWGQNSGQGNPGVGESFYAYVLRPMGTNFLVMMETGPLTVTNVGVNTFAAPPFALQMDDRIAHYGLGIPLSIDTGGPSSVYFDGAALPMPAVGQLLQLPGPTYPLWNDGGRNYAIAVIVSEIPNLAATQSGNSFILSWPANGASTLLQTTNLASGFWTTNATFTATTGTNTVTVPLSVGNLFFRLRSP